MLGWECNCYYYKSFFSNQVLVYGSVFSVSPVEAGGGQGENVGVGVSLLVVYDSVFCQPSGSRRGSGRE